MSSTYLLAQMLIASQNKEINYDEYYEYLDEKADRERKDLEND
jgi:hypothetical protein